VCIWGTAGSFPQLTPPVPTDRLACHSITKITHSHPQNPRGLLLPSDFDESGQDGRVPRAHHISINDLHIYEPKSGTRTPHPPYHLAGTEPIPNARRALLRSRNECK